MLVVVWYIILLIILVKVPPLLIILVLFVAYFRLSTLLSGRSVLEAQRFMPPCILEVVQNLQIFLQSISFEIFHQFFSMIVHIIDESVSRFEGHR